MNTVLLARKGEAVPTGLSDASEQSLAYFAARRSITFGQAHAAPVSAPEKTKVAASPRPRPAASILRSPRRPTDQRRRFTFRLDNDLHEQFCAAARLLGCSRQKLLERALGRYLEPLDSAATLAGDPAPTAVPRLV